jgi:signal transduction histidine kinase
MKKHRSQRPDEYRQLIQEFTRSLTLIVDEEQLRSSISAKLRDFFGLERVAIFLREGDGAPFRIVAERGMDPEIVRNVTFPSNGRLARWLKVNEEPLLLDENPGVVAFLDAQERDTLTRLDAFACFPLVALNQLKGFLTLGRSDTGAPQLDQGDRELLSLFSGQAALAFENAALLREQRSRLKRLYRAERLATAGEMAAGAAHEIRNPLTSIRSAIQHLRTDYDDESPRAELIDDILAEVDRINGIVGALLSFARPAEPRFESVPLAELVRMAIALVDAQAQTQGIAVSAEIAEDISVEADPNLIKQVVLNVVMNAMQAMPNGGELTISALPLAGFAELRMGDSGPGIPSEDRERLFDPFFTTKTEGTGLGLSVCYGIVQRHGGEIEVESETGQGTVVRIRLPRSTAP